MEKKLRAAQIQMSVKETKAETVRYLTNKMKEICDGSVDMVCLPEMFCCPYKTELFPEYAEPEGGMLWSACAELAAKHQVYLSAGTMPEEDFVREAEGLPKEKRIYNTAYMFDRNGRQIGKHRKMHLYEVHAKGRKSFREADTLSAGNEVTLFDTEFGRGGLCVCYDIRFIEMIRLMTLKGAEFILVPAAFNMITGPAHWELVIRSQAMYNQIFVLGTSLARDPSCGFISWGHSMSADPGGMVLSRTEEKEDIIFTDIDLSRIGEARTQLPMLSQRREDIYELRLL